MVNEVGLAISTSVQRPSLSSISLFYQPLFYQSITIFIKPFSTFPKTQLGSNHQNPTTKHYNHDDHDDQRSLTLRAHLRIHQPMHNSQHQHRDKRKRKPTQSDIPHLRPQQNSHQAVPAPGVGALLPQALPARALPLKRVAVHAVRLAAGFVGPDGGMGGG